MSRRSCSSSHLVDCVHGFSTSLGFAVKVYACLELQMLQHFTTAVYLQQGFLSCVCYRQRPLLWSSARSSHAVLRCWIPLSQSSLPLYDVSWCLQTACVWSCALNTPAVLAATGSADFSCKLWNAITGLEQHTWQHPSIVRSVHFSAASDLLATGCRDKTARIFSVTVPSSDPLISFTGLRDSIQSVKFANDDRELLVAYSDAPGLGILDVRSGQEARHIDMPSKVRAIDLSYSGGAAQTITIASGNEVSVLEGPSLTSRASVKLENPVASASLSPDGKSVVAGGEDMWAYLMDFPSGKVRQVRSALLQMSFSDHGRKLRIDNQFSYIQLVVVPCDLTIKSMTNQAGSLGFPDLSHFPWTSPVFTGVRVLMRMNLVFHPQ